MAQALLKSLTEDDYLEAESRSEVRHEYVYGAIYAMAGGSANHSTIALNLASQCNLRGSGNCKTFGSDMKLRMDMGGLYYYPDVMLVCDASDDEQQFKSSPCMIAEVLSPSTESIDRREKWTAYQKLSSLREYILLAQDRPYIEVYKRVNFRQWGLTVLGAEDTLELSCMPLNIPVMDLYRGVDFSKAAKSP
jgi:Uma2 family endonuclease